MLQLQDKSWDEKDRERVTLTNLLFFFFFCTCKNELVMETGHKAKCDRTLLAKSELSRKKKGKK